MRAVGRRGKIAALDLVLALRAGFHALEDPRLDREIDDAVITNLECSDG